MAVLPAFDRLGAGHLIECDGADDDRADDDELDVRRDAQEGQAVSQKADEQGSDV